MKIKDIIDAPTINHLEPNVLRGFHYSHFDEFLKDKYLGNIDFEFLKVNGITVEEKYHMDIDSYRRYISISVVKLDDVPFMIIRNGGREGDDSSDNFVINQLAYKLFQSIVYNSLTISKYKTSIVDINSDLEILDSFHHETLTVSDLGKKHIKKNN